MWKRQWPGKLSADTEGRNGEDMQAGLVCGLHEGRGYHVGRGGMGRAGIMGGHITFTRKEGKSNVSKNKVF